MVPSQDFLKVRSVRLPSRRPPLKPVAHLFSTQGITVVRSSSVSLFQSRPSSMEFVCFRDRSAPCLVSSFLPPFSVRYPNRQLVSSDAGLPPGSANALEQWLLFSDSCPSTGIWGVQRSDIEIPHRDGLPTVASTSSWDTLRFVFFLSLLSRGSALTGLFVRPSGLLPGRRPGLGRI